MISHSDADSPQLMRLKDVCSLLSISKATVYRWVDEGKFPEPVVLGQEEGKRSAVRWYMTDVLNWLEARPKGVQKDDS
jgi:prophage regulatory protein|tara:strand:+ start:323 stop:556 length:234 start_codon:yes stop_codon:yes gene_type:complete